MKVKCLNCGLVHEKEAWWKGGCPRCGFNRYCIEIKEKEEKVNKEILTTMSDLAKEFLRVVKEEGIKIVKKESVFDDPFRYRTEKKKEGLAFEIIDIKDGNKVRCRKIYLNGHIEGFKGDPCITNHILPKIIALKALLKQMNKDYRDLIEAYTIRGLPLDQVPLHELYIREMEGIDNIKI